MTIAQNIKTIREKYNLSQKEFSVIAGVTEQAVSSWETGIREPRMGAIQKIADHFGLKKSDIIDNQNINDQLLLDGDVTKAFAKLMASKDTSQRELKLEIIKDIVQLDFTETQLKTLSAFLKSFK